jgi:hypothetical protein
VVMFHVAWANFHVANFTWHGFRLCASGDQASVSICHDFPPVGPALNQLAGRGRLMFMTDTVWRGLDAQFGLTSHIYMVRL